MLNALYYTDTIIDISRMDENEYRLTMEERFLLALDLKYLSKTPHLQIGAT